MMHDDEKKKETLTKENIKKDILPLLLWDIAKIIRVYICFPIIALLIDWLFACLHIPFRIAFVVFVILTIIAVPAFICTFIRIYKTCKFQFVIDRDFLVDKKEGGYHSGVGWIPILGGIVAIFYKLYKLQFGRYGKFAIQVRRNYKWSSLYPLSDKELFNSSEINDEFLLVSLNGKRIDRAYNLKLFDFKE